MYTFFKAAANKTSGPGSSIPRAPDMRHRHEKAAALAVGDWVIFDGNGDEDDLSGSGVLCLSQSGEEVE